MFLRPNFSSSWKDIQEYYSFWFISSRGDRTGWHRSSRKTRQQWIWFALTSRVGPLDIIPLTPLNNILRWILFLPHFTGKETKLQKTTVTKMTQLVSGKRKPSGPPHSSSGPSVTVRTPIIQRLCHTTEVLGCEGWISAWWVWMS